MQHLTVYFLLLFLVATICANAPALKSYNIDPNSVTVSGVSSGGYFANQMHIAFSSTVKAAGIIAAGPFFCANDNVEIALTACMKFPNLISLTELWSITERTASMGYIDDLSNLQNSKVWIFSGTGDTVVHPGVVQKLVQYYGQYIHNSDVNIKTHFNTTAEHSWVTDSFGNACSHLGTPFINNCGYDSAGNMFKHIYGDDLKPRVVGGNLTANILSFNQSEFVLEHPHLISLNEYGYLYVPTECHKGARCRLHMAFHGCKQSPEQIGDTFVRNVGLNEWAESNNIIVIYPQTHTSLPNQNACFDCWGYTGPAYASKEGFQMMVMKHIIARAMGQK